MMNHDEVRACLQALVHQQGWLSLGGELALIDGVWVEGLSAPLWVGLAQAQADTRWFLSLSSGAQGWEEASASTLFHAEFLPQLARQGVLPLSGGGRIVFEPQGLDLQGLSLRGADLGSSSNGVSRVDVGGLEAVHKVFRRLDEAQHEAAVGARLQALQEPLLPRLLGAYHYQAPNGQRLSLGLLSEYFAGEGVHAVLSRSLRALWRGAPQEPDLPQLLQGWQDCLGGFHTRLDQALGRATEEAQAPRFDLARHAAQVQARLQRLLPQVQSDTLLSPPQARHLADLLASAGHVLVAALQGRELAASACHGDLHLSHLLARPEPGGGWQRRLVDVSPLAERADAPAFRCSHRLMDWVALARALDYFYLDEFTFELKRRLGCSSALAMQQQLLARLDPQQLTPAVRAELDAVARPGAAWRAEVQQALCGAAAAEPGWELFYFGRLLQELDYNYQHRRAHFRCVDFLSALAAWAPKGR